MPSDERDLLLALGSHDRDAAASFAARFGDLLLVFLLRAVRNELLALDLWHETLAEARYRARWYDPEEGGVAGWLLSLSAEIVHAGAEAGAVPASARRRGGREPRLSPSSDDRAGLRALLAAGRDLSGLEPEAVRRFDVLLEDMPAPHELRRLRPSGLVAWTMAATPEDPA